MPKMQDRIENSPLTEDAKLDFLKTKYGEAVKHKSPKGQDDFDLLIASDPTSRPGSPGKYSEWIVQQYLKSTNKNFIEDLGKMTSYLELYGRFKQSLPVEQRNLFDLTIDQLFDAAEQITKVQNAKKGTTKTKEEVFDTEAKTLYKDDGVLAVQPLTFPAANRLGKMAASNDGVTMNNWCTSASAGNYQSYTGEGKYLVIFLFKAGKDEPHGKSAQLEVNKDGTNRQLKDIRDHEITLDTFLSWYKGTKLDEFARWLASFTGIRTKAAMMRHKTGDHLGVARKLMLPDISQEELPTRLELARAVDLSDEELAVLKKDAVKDPLMQRRLMMHQAQTTDEFRAALKSDIDSTRLIAGRNPKLPVELMREIAMGDDMAAKVGLQQNPSCPPDIQKLINLPEE